ncbi:uncharacterized protein BP5553_04611 [Venustampulla echinocandica]|uniref:Uncharacterized protein n=1 Tax=Venustampulla echinocandica TaxID=2656787 RepID=A0A370TNT7_9HELO|nr:uncharacterized protein BP5553_04611 [Venustampulla echinocandica]RDL37178.1 hypothetical protein BP5553_04611 [Venustampulla echinocandica]
MVTRARGRASAKPTPAHNIEQEAHESQQEVIGDLDRDIDDEATASLLNRTTHNVSKKHSRNGKPKITSMRQKGPVMDEDSDDAPTDEPPERPVKRARPNPRAKQSTTDPTSSTRSRSVAVVIYQTGGDKVQQPGRPQTRSVKQKLDLEVSGSDNHAGGISPDRAPSDESPGAVPKKKVPQPPRTTSRSPASLVPSSHSICDDEKPDEDNGLEPLSEDSEHEVENEGSPESSEEERGPSPLLLPNMMHPGFLGDMVKIAERVGHKYDREWNSYEPVLEGLNLRTSLGKKLDQKLKRLNIAYARLQDAKTSEDNRTIDAIDDKIYSRILDLTEVIEEALSALPENPRSRIRYPMVTPLLVDLYFNILPMLLKCIKLGVEARDDDGRTSLLDLNEFDRLINLYWRLGDTAVNIPPQLQPTPGDCLDGIKSRSSTFQTKQPTREALVKARSLHRMLRRKILNSESMVKNADNPRLAMKRKEADEEELRWELSQKKLERRRLLEEVEHRLEEKARVTREHRQLINKTHRLQREAIDRQLRKRQLKTGVNSTRRWARPSNEARVASLPPSQYEGSNEYDVEDDSDPFADDYSPRIHLFPNNNKKSNVPAEWSNKQKATFIECMRLEQGQDRYERAAKRLQCSMDEVFAYAKNLQEAMDVAHEKGLMNSEEDEWTYDVWVERD